MLYRIHRYRPDGKSLGYIYLCPGYVNISGIRDDLVRIKIVSENWFAPEELRAVAEPSNVYGASGYSVVRSRPNGKNPYLFYLHPIKPLPEQLQYEPWNTANWYLPPYTTTATNFITNPFFQQSPSATLRQANPNDLDQYVLANPPGQQVAFQGPQPPQEPHNIRELQDYIAQINTRYNR